MPRSVQNITPIATRLSTANPVTSGITVPLKAAPMAQPNGMPITVESDLGRFDL